jgi:hypothetical protein
MPFKDPARQRRAVADSMRRTRLYEAAVHSGHPKALAAEAARHPMKPANDMLAELERLPDRDARQARKAEYLALLAKCQGQMDGARERYLKLRAEVIAEMEMFS